MSKRRRPESWWRIKAQAFARDGHACVYCGCSTGLLEGDHYIPLCKGGGWDVENIVTACKPCNLSKGTSMPEDWWSPIRG